MLKKVAFTMYPVQNMERARRFYEKTLGLTPGSISAGGAWVEFNLKWIYFLRQFVKWRLSSITKAMHSLCIK